MKYSFQGDRINNAIIESEIIVHVGAMRCDVTFIEETGLGCILPEEQPSAGDFNGQDTKRGLPVVWVSLKQLLVKPLDLDFLGQNTERRLYVV